MREGVSAARACAYAVVRRVFEQDAYADRALHAEARARRLDGATGRSRWPIGLPGPSNARHLGPRRRRVDRAVAGARLDAPILAALRLGLMQILLMDAPPITRRQ